MNTTIDEELHHRHCKALAEQLVEEALWALEHAGIAELEMRRRIANAVLFRVCAVLDGSAHGGTLDDEAIAPFIGFYKNRDIDEVLVPEDGSAMHEIIGDLVDECCGPQS